MAEHDGKVVFDLEIDASRARNDLNRALSSIKTQAGSTKIKVDADTASATTQLHRVKAEADGVGGKKPTVAVTATTDAALDALETVQAEADKVDDKSPDVSVTATDEASKPLSDVGDKADEVGAKTPDVSVTATDAATGPLEDVAAKADEVGAKSPDVSVTATDAATHPLEDIAAEADTVDAKAPDIAVTVTDAATQPLEDIAARADELDGKNVNVSVNSSDSGSSTFKNGIIQGVGQGVGNAALGMARGAIGSIFSSGSSYEYGLAKASTLMPEGADRDAFGRGLLDLAAEVGMDPAMMTEAAYNALSASQTFGNAGGDVMLDFLRTASKTAVGGYTDTNTAAAAMAKTINAYGLDTSDADRIANIMLKTQNRGITDVGKLSGSLSHVTATAANAGVSFEQVGAMLSTLTAQGVETAEATTQSRSLINEMVKANTTANKNMQAALQGSQWEGKSFQEIMASGGNIVDILVQMSDYAKANGLTMTDMFSSVEAAQAAQMLLVNSGETYRDNLAYMEDEANVVDDAYSTMAETTEQTLARIRTQFAAYATQFMGALTPALQKFLQLLDSDKFKATMGGLVEKLSDMLSGDFVEDAADALINLINWILDLINDPWGTISAGITGALEAAWNWLMGKASELGAWIKDSIMAALEGIELPGWLQSIVNVFGGGSGGSGSGVEYGKPVQANGASQFGGNRAEGHVSGKRSSGGGAERVENSAEALGDSLDSTKTAVDSAKESADALAESQAQTAEATAQTATNAETTAQNESNTATATASAAKSAANSASRAQRLAASITSLNLKTSTAASGMDAVAQAITRLVNAVNTAATRAGGVVTPPSATKYAVGLDYVPYDNYPALLHKGEMILNAAEASAYRFTGSSISGGGIDAGALASAMSGLAVEMDGRVVGRLVERSVSAQQAVRLNRTQYGRG